VRLLLKEVLDDALLFLEGALGLLGAPLGLLVPVAGERAAGRRATFREPLTG
jgi:hypothetical protein